MGGYLKMGFKVRICNLRNKAELNGAEGVALSKVSGKDAYELRLDNGGTMVKLFRANLEMLLSTASAAPAVSASVPAAVAPAASAAAAPAPAAAAAAAVASGVWQPVPEGDLKMGFKVRICNLRNKAELNGAEGVALSKVSGKDAYELRLDNGGTMVK